MLTVPQAAQQTGRSAETIRRWIRAGRLRARKVGTQHVIDEHDLAVVTDKSDTLELPASWQTFPDGTKQPDWVALLRRSRNAH